MEIWQALVMAVVEGITEFLPISSTGHLILASKLLGVAQTDFVKSFEVFIQLGAILAVVQIYIKELWQKRQVWPKLLMGFLPTALVGLVAYRWIKDYLLGNLIVTLVSLIVGGLVIIGLEKSGWMKKKKTKRIEDLSNSEAAGVGVVQAVSVIPGVSRAAATIVGGMLVGLERTEAVKMSFLLAIPTMAAATGWDLLQSGWAFSSYEWMVLAIGFVGSFGAAWVAVKWLVGFVKTHNLEMFGYYRIILVLLWLLIF